LAEAVNNIKSILSRISRHDDEKALKELFDLFYGKLLEYAKFYLKGHSASQEIVSDVFIKLWNNRENIGDIDNINSYLYVAVKRQSLNYIRDNKRKVHQSLDANDPITIVELTSPEKMLLSKEFMEVLNTAVLNLPSKCRLVYTLVKEDGMKYKEVADSLNISVKTVEMHVGKALKRIKIAFDKSSQSFSNKFQSRFN
jgi:RNA polymerase sigma-70 factor (family 1)